MSGLYLKLSNRVPSKMQFFPELRVHKYIGQVNKLDNKHWKSTVLKFGAFGFDTETSNMRDNVI